jgi:acyl transferase domain-containing protein/NAD(P)-dependent dehydrogenase (short-subunit alcohol dehydrogenase family)/acyl carrier protein
MIDRGLPDDQNETPDEVVRVDSSPNLRGSKYPDSSASRAQTREGIAIVGIGCRFPGGVSDPDSFWLALREEMDAIGEIPSDRIDIAAYYDPRPATPGKMMTHWGGFLDQIDQFDASFFGISPREADRLDPQQRLLLEVAWEALEDAGQSQERLSGSDAGVFIGMWLNDYESRMFADPASVDFYMTTGSGRYSASGRLSYVFGLQGPSLTIDTACSSSLVAVHLACRSLWSGECSLALAGGANVILQPQISIAYSQSKMMAPDGRCKFGDAGANGYVRSEGAGIVVLKPLSAALRDGDAIYALIQGSAVNNDGRSSGYMATPARIGQEELLRRAYQDAGVSPGSVGYVEAHGTGTSAGDPVEIGALGSVLSEGRSQGSLCYVGSVKSNFGHTEGAAGIAGLIKTALVLKHGIIPASLHLKELNPVIPWEKLPLAIPRESREWSKDSMPLIAGVSAFGIAGTNAHIVLTEAPPKESVEEAPPGSARGLVLPLSAASAEGLAALARAYISALENEGAPSFFDICYTASVRRTHLEHRLALVATSRSEAGVALKAFLQGERLPGLHAERAQTDPPRRIVFVCPGQGSQWVGMGRQLLQTEGVFREALEKCEQAMQPFVDWSLLEQLKLDPESPGYRLGEVDVIQPSLVAVEIALAALWRSWGVEPAAVVGHSMGEVAAAFIAGVLSLEDAMRVVCTRSLLLKRVSGHGAMAVVALPMERAQELLKGREDDVSVAVSNSPRSTVLSGDPGVIEEILNELRARDIFCRPVKVDVASHSPQMDPLTGELLRALDGIEACEAKFPIYSTVKAQRRDGAAFDASYWVENLRRPVLFLKTVQQLAQEEYTVFVELSPHPILVSSIDESLHDLGREGYAIGSLEREKDERTTLLSSVGRLYALGCPVDWSSFFPSRGKVVSLPSYPWQRQRFWWEAKPAEPGGASVWPRIVPGNGNKVHPLLGIRLPEVATLPGAMIWQNQLGQGFRERLRKGGFQGDRPLPEQVYVEMVSAAASEAFGVRLHRVPAMTVAEPLVLPEASELQMQLVLTENGPKQGSFEIFSRGSATDDSWTENVSGKIETGEADPNWFYEVQWKEKNRPAANSKWSEGPAGRWLVFADRSGLGATFAKLLESRGEECVLAFAGESFRALGTREFEVSPKKPEELRRLFAEVLGCETQSRLGVVYLWGLDAETGAELTGSTLEDSLALTGDGVLHLVQALARADWKAALRLWLVTRAAQAVEPGDGERLSVVQAPTWGLGRVIALEQVELWGGLLDLPAQAEASSSEALAAALLEEFQTQDGEDQVALRGGRRYVPRLVKSLPGVSTARPFALHSEATYLITGGLGGLGLRVARWLAECGARYLVLTGRTGLPDRSTWTAISAGTETGRRIAAVQELESLGANVHIVKADVADEAEMKLLWEELRRNHPPLRGVIHAAGTVSVHDLADLTADELHRVLRSKVMGAWQLHQLLPAVQGPEGGLDFFVLFSSGASVWGSQKLAHYAAANHFLDALAHHRASQGLPILSVNWGWWEGDGLVSGELGTLFERVGLKGLPQDGAVDALAYLLETGVRQKIVANVDWERFGPIYEARRRRPLLEELIVREKPEAKTEAAKEQEKSRLLEEVQQAAPGERRAILHREIRTVVAGILGFASSDQVDPKQGFFKMGMDSIMTVQLRSRLEASLGFSLPPTLAFEYPTVEFLAKYLAETVGNLSGPAEVHDVIQPEPVEPAELEEWHDDLSEEGLLELLERKLEQFG